MDKEKKRRNMEKKSASKKADFNKSKNEIFATPSKRNISATYIKSVATPTFNASFGSRQDTVFKKHSKKLLELGLDKSQWITYRINALYNFHYQQSMLRSYEQKLKAIVKTDISRLGPESQYYNLKFAVEMQYFNNMAFTENDFPPIKIIIDAEDVNEDDVYCTGILLSVERKQGFMEKERKKAKATILPLFLVAYTDKIFFESVKYFLENNFGCLVSPLKFSTCDLIWMVALFSAKRDSPTGVTTVQYGTPFEEVSTIRVSYDPETLVEVWESVVAPTSTQVNPILREEQAYEFISILESHFFDLFKIVLSKLEMKLIRTPLATVTANHSVELNDTEKLYFVMRHLTHLAQETIRLNK